MTKTPARRLMAPDLAHQPRWLQTSLNPKIMRFRHELRRIGMRRFLPSMGSLKAFEASARHLSFSQAG
ncbi:hypothetical protein ABTM76_19100, partial [Acinetobacter baumannii]